MGFPPLTTPVRIRLDFRVNSKNRLAGRFLPSRVYARWKWTVRCGLCVVPLILFLAGSVVVYLQPGRYQSTTVFKYTGERPAAEVVALALSRSCRSCRRSTPESSWHSVSTRRTSVRFGVTSWMHR